MSVWLVRAGKTGEYESHFLQEQCVYLTWTQLNLDLSEVPSPDALREALGSLYDDAQPGRLKNWAAQIWAFARKMEVGDWVVLPSKKKASIHIGEITGKYQHLPAGPDPYFHTRAVNWFAQDIPRSNFDQDILYSFGAFLTVCRITRNDAEIRIKQMANNDWKVPANSSGISYTDDDTGESASALDIERFSVDQIAKHLTAKYSGHGMERLVEAILNAKGFLTYRSPEGADKGVDLLAAPGELGFGSPRICVQVKSGDKPVDRPTLDQLVGAMQNFGADTGLLVSWAGFKNSVDREEAAQFFRVRLWDQDKLIEELLACYERLDDELRAELPMKKVWALAISE